MEMAIGRGRGVAVASGSASDQYIWIRRWDEFQTMQKKRGKPWAPPWVKLYLSLLDQPAYIDLSPENRSLLVGLWMLFARTRGTVTKETRKLSRQLHQRVTERQLAALNHDGFIDFCSGTVLEQRRNAFWNSSALEVEVEKELGPLPPEETSRAEAETNGNGLHITLKEIPW